MGNFGVLHLVFGSERALLQDTVDSITLLGLRKQETGKISVEILLHTLVITSNF
jgi:hypothetical protein